MDWQTLFTRLMHSDNGNLLLAYDEVQQWPAGILEDLINLKLVRKSHDAQTVICPGCEEQCYEPVHTFRDQNRAFIVCTQRDDTNRVKIDLKQLQQWQMSIESTYQILSYQTGLSVADLKALPLRWQDVFELTGSQWAISSRYLLNLAATFRICDIDPSENRIVVDAHFCTITYKQETKTVKLLKGMRYILYLIQNKHRNVHIHELSNAIDPPDVSFVDDNLSEQSAAELELQGLSLDSVNHDELVDAKTISDCKSAIDKIKEDIEEASAFGDYDRQEELEIKREEIEHYLYSNLNHKGKSRLSNSPAENRRKGIGKLIGRAVKNLDKPFPTLAEHFQQIQTGEYCCYHPKPDIEWKIFKN